MGTDTWCVTTNDDFCGLQSQVQFNSVIGVNYYIFVTGYSTSIGLYDLSISGMPTYFSFLVFCSSVRFPSPRLLYIVHIRHCSFVFNSLPLSLSLFESFLFFLLTFSYFLSPRYKFRRKAQLSFCPWAHKQFFSRVHRLLFNIRFQWSFIAPVVSNEPNKHKTLFIYFCNLFQVFF